MAEFRRESCPTQQKGQTGIPVCVSPSPETPQSFSRALGQRKEWRPCLPLLAAVGLLLASYTWPQGYNIEVCSAEKGVHVPAAILKPQRTFEQKRAARRRVSFEDDLQHDDNTHETAGAGSGRNLSTGASFEETKMQARAVGGQMFRKQGALRGQSDTPAAYLNLEHHAASVRQHADNKGVYERHSSGSSSAAEENTTQEELQDEEERLSRADAGGSLASVKEGRSKEEARKEALERLEKGGFWKNATRMMENLAKGSPWRFRPQKRKRTEEVQAGEAEAR